MKTVLFAPGGGHGFKSADYASVLETFENAGYASEFVHIVWPHRTIDNWVEQFEAAYAKHRPEDTVLAGFSWGAMTAFVTAAKRPPAKLLLCSFSPYFSDDPRIQNSLKDGPPRWLGKRRMEAFAQLNFSDLAKQVTSKTVVLMGEKEAEKFPDLKHRCEEAARQIAGAQLVTVPGAGHEIDHPNYRAAIKSHI